MFVNSDILIAVGLRQKFISRHPQRFSFHSRHKRLDKADIRNALVAETSKRRGMKKRTPSRNFFTIAAIELRIYIVCIKLPIVFTEPSVIFSQCFMTA